MTLIDDQTMSKTVSKNIQYYMKRSGITRAELARALHISYSTLSEWIHGNACPRMNKVKLMADFFGCNISDLLEGPGSTDSEPVRIHVLGSLDDTDIIEDIFVGNDMYGKGEYIGLKVHGDSMAPRLFTGDVVVVRKQKEVESGDIIIAEVNGDTTCKKLQIDADGITLIPENEKYRAMSYTNDDIETGIVGIYGKVVEVRRKIEK